jgi:hypothetical protein
MILEFLLLLLFFNKINFVKKKNGVTFPRYQISSSMCGISPHSFTKVAKDQIEFKFISNKGFSQCNHFYNLNTKI